MEKIKVNRKSNYKIYLNLISLTKVIKFVKVLDFSTINAICKFI